MADLKYSRLLVKFSGESVAGEEGIGIDPKILDSMAVSIKLCKELGAEIGIVIGAMKYLICLPIQQNKKSLQQLGVGQNLLILL